MDFQEFKTLVIAKAQAMEIAEYELYYQVAESVIAEAFGHEINRFSANNAGGVCFRCIVDGKMGYASTERLDEKQAEQIVIQAVENGKALEINTSRFIKFGDGMPGMDILKRFRELGGEYVTLGSDSHQVETVAQGFAEVTQRIQTCGFDYLATYVKRKAEMWKL